MAPTEKRYINILLLTNRNSDNTGDQVIEACDISLLSVIMKQLGLEVQITSRDASIVTKYVETREPDTLAEAEELIQESDLILVGGAPMFNFLYQNFYERTAVILELAEKHQKPVLFSAIGVEGYSDANEKCQRLKKTLNLDCVRQITTRDDFQALQNYKENESLVIGKVADPAVFSSKVFEAFKTDKRQGEKKKIGIFILRQGGFVDNKVPFSRDKAVSLWLDLIQELEARGYDYELTTSGHFADEAFLDYLIRKHGVSEDKCTFNINTPEELVKTISSCDAVISTRLHPSIVSFALDVPSLGIVWNQKVTGFYESIGYRDRVFETEGISANKIADKLEQILSEGVKKDAEFLMSVYRTLFCGIRDALGLSGNLEPCTYEELLQQMPVYPGTSQQEQEEKLQRKSRRLYGAYNKRISTVKSLENQIAQFKRQNQWLSNKQIIVSGLRYIRRRFSSR